MIPEGWLEYRVKDIGEVITGKTPSSSNPEQFGNILPFVTPTDLKDYNKNIYQTERGVSEEGVKVFGNKILPENSVLVSCIGSDMGKVAMNRVPCLTNQQINSIVVNDEIATPDFVYYMLISKYKLLKGMATGGSTMPIVNKTDFENIKLSLPKTVSEQSRIASILSSLDDKIELNLQMNKTLESIAQAIFKEWFVDFRFPGFDGKLVDGVPKEWRKLSIGSLFKSDIAGDWGKEVGSDDYSVNVSVIRGTDFGNICNGDISRVPNRYIKNSDFIKKKVIDGDILLEISGGSKDQPTGRTILISDIIIGLLNCPAVSASFCRLIRPLNHEYSIFLSVFFSRFYAIGGTWEYQNQSTGISNFQFRYFSENMKIYLPSDPSLLSRFSQIIEPMILKIHRNILEIKTLVSIRDTLLPKLMTGKIRVA